MGKPEETEKMGEALEHAGREFGKHSGPRSDERERATFGRDLRVAALRYARAYYAEAREYGLIPEYERVTITQGPVSNLPDELVADALAVHQQRKPRF